MGFFHAVTGYETLHRIAALYGAQASAIWNAGQNQELRRTRTPERLFEGDRVWVPGEPRDPVIEVGPAPVPLRTGRAYVLSAPLLHDVIVQFRDEEDAVLANWQYVLTYPGASVQGSFDGSGTLRARLPSSVLCADIEYWHADERDVAHRRTLHVGRLDPIETHAGVRASLENLGYLERGYDGSAGSLEAAVAEFQRDHDLEVTGRVDDSLRERLRGMHRASE